MLTTSMQQLSAVNTKRNASEINGTNDSVNRISLTVFENGTLEGAMQIANTLCSTGEGVSLLQSPVSNESTELPKTVITNDGDVFDSSMKEVLDESIALLADDANLNTVLNHSGISSNVLESSVYSEFQFPAPHSLRDGRNTSICSKESGKNNTNKKLSRRSNKCSSLRTVGVFANTFLPQYTAIFFEPNSNSRGILSNSSIEQISAAATTTPFVDHHNHHQYLSGVPVSFHRSTLEASQVHRECFCKWFSRPSLPFVIGVLALGGVACTLGGIILGSTGLVEHSTQYLSAALLMIGIGVSLLVISGAIWRLSVSDEADECPCLRHIETCRNCNSPYCNNRIFLSDHHINPEFQHRPPPPSYLTSLNECAIGLLFHRDITNTLAQHSQLRINTPPPLYRSTNALNTFAPINNGIGTATTDNAGR